MLFAAALLLSTAALAFPPAPYHVIYGLVRDEYGTPFTDSRAQVILQTATGVRIKGTVVPGQAPGVNYQLQVPMDSGLTPANYMATALRVAAPFKLYVIVGNTTNLPIQMTGSLSLLGAPGQRTRLDLTLGDDSNGNGIPDAWEYAFLNALGSTLNLADLKADGVYTRDGLTLHQQFLLGDILFDTGNSFSLKLVNVQDGSPLLEFTTMTGRSYTIQGSPDLRQWSPLSFVLPAQGPGSGAYTFLYAPDIRAVQVQALQPPSGPVMRFFRLVLQ